MKHQIFELRLYLCLLLSLLASISLLKAQYPLGYSKYERELAEKNNDVYLKPQKFDSSIRFYAKEVDVKNINTTADNPVKENNIYGIGIRSLRGQKEILLNKGCTLKTTTAYFAGTGFPNVTVVTFSGTSFNPLDSFINLCQAGTSITFDNITLQDKKGKTFLLPGQTYVVLRGEDTIAPILSPGYNEFLGLLQNNFNSGTIYLSGEGFNVILIIPAKDLKQEKYINYIGMCKPGSVVTFDQCSYWDKNKKTAVVINKVIKL